MDLEQLTKTQIILLTLLVSFVTSIATGIVTVTLLDQAPPAITQTINRVVERTVERVVPGESQSASVITQEKTVVVKEEDLITDSIEKNRESLVRITGRTAKEGEEGAFVSMGIIISEEGLVATDASQVLLEGSYRIVLPDGNVRDAEVVLKREGIRVALLSIPHTELGTPAPTYTPVSFADTGALKLGQTVVSLTGAEQTSAGMGIIASLIEVTPEGENTTPTLVRIDTTISSVSTSPGSPLLNIFGDVVGIQTTVAQSVGGPGSHSPAPAIITAVEAYRQPIAGTTEE